MTKNDKQKGTREPIDLKNDMIDTIGIIKTTKHEQLTINKTRESDKCY